MKPPFGIFTVQLILSLLLVFSTACSSVNINSQDAHIRGRTAVTPELETLYQPEKGTSNYQRLAKHNVMVMSWYQAHEKPFYHDQAANFPKTCLALSGGGIRAAAHSIGVMKGLAEKGILQNMDIISAVSGGAYALSWFYTKNSLENVVEKMFAEDKYIEELASRADMYTALDFVQSFFLDTAFIPVNFFANGVFGWHANTTPSRANYEYEIRHLFQGGEPYSFNEIAKWIKENNLPYFIINTTARIDDDMFHHGSKLSNSVFEFTPLRFGSDAFGYGYTGETDFPFDFSRAVSVSGAAADSSAVAGDSQKLLVSLLNHDLGYYINNYTEYYRKKKAWWTRLVPFPFYFLGPHYLRDKSGTDIYLTDGGHSENLGAFSIIRRACETIFIVDSEYDPKYLFESYFKLKQALKDEMGVDLMVPEIDEVGRQLVCRVEGERGCVGVSETKGQKQFDRGVAVVKGEISAFPLVDPDYPNMIKEKSLSIIYIKLAIDEAQMAPLVDEPELVGEKVKAIERFGEIPVEYYIKSQKGDCGNIILKCAFPQYSTVDQSYTDEQFRAYVDLGYHNVLNSPLIPKQ